MHHTFASNHELADQPPVSRFLLPLSGWVLQPLVQLDRHRPGVLAEIVGARSRKRQAIYAALAAGALDRAEDVSRALLGPTACWHGAVWPALLAEGLLTADPRAVVAGAYGTAPDGFLTLLSRAGPEPLRQTTYARLHAIYADRRQRRPQQALSAAEKLTDNLVDIVEILPDEALRPAVIGACRRPDDARIVAHCVHLAIQRGRSRADLAKQLSDLGPISTLFGLVNSLLRSFANVPHAPDVSAIPGADVLTSSAALDRAGRDNEDCLGNIPIAWATSMAEVFFVVLSGQDLIAQLHRTSAGHILTGVHRPSNHDVTARERNLACDLFEAAGFAVLASLRRTDDAQLVGAMMDGVQLQLDRLLD